MVRMRVGVFLLIGIMFCLGLFVLKQWGRQAAVAAYRPVLVEKLSNECRALRFGAAEALALRALRTTPQYADTIRATTSANLNVMPELAAELDRLSKDKMLDHAN